MEVYWKTAAGVLLALILCLTVGKQEKDLAMVLSIAACAMTAVGALHYLKPVVTFLMGLEERAKISGEFSELLLKLAGICLVSELGGQLCADAGNSSLGKSLQLLGSAVMLQLSLPVFQGMLDMIGRILGQ